jgi:hypothetical protein
LIQRFTDIFNEYLVHDPDVSNFLRHVWDRKFSKDLQGLKEYRCKSPKRSKTTGVAGKLHEHKIYRRELGELMGLVDSYIHMYGMDNFLDLIEKQLPTRIYRDVLEKMERYMTELVFEMNKTDRQKFFKAIDKESIEHEEQGERERKLSHISKRQRENAIEGLFYGLREYTRRIMGSPLKDKQLLEVVDKLFPILEEYDRIYAGGAPATWVPKHMEKEIVKIFEGVGVYIFDDRLDDIYTVFSHVGAKAKRTIYGQRR